jgi:hypothetical protein
MAAFGQSREMGIMLGVMNYKGDLQKATFAGQNNLPGFGFLYRRSYSNHWAFKTAISYGHIKADDAQSDDPFCKNRNLNFKTSILEGTGQFEFNFFPYQTANPSTFFTPYMSVGLSVFRFNPKAYYNGGYVELQPLGTEGQGTNANPDKEPYKRTNLAFVFGGGFKWKIGRRWSVILESVVRKTYTDYLDDVSGVYADPNAIRVEYGKTAYYLSDRTIVKNKAGNIGRQRGDNTNRDWYHFTGVQFTYTLSKHYIDQCRPFRIKLW